MTTKEKVISLINYANETTGKSDADLTNCVKSLVDGYGGGGDEGEFNTFDVVDSIAKSIITNKSDIQTYVYASHKDDTGEKFNILSSTYDMNLALIVLNFSENFSKLSCGLCFVSDSILLNKGAEWYVDTKERYTAMWFLEDSNRKIYNYKPFKEYHPVYNGTNFVDVGTESEIQVVNKYMIGNVLNTLIESTNNIVIVTFSSGVWLYKYTQNNPIANFSNNTYSFSATQGCTRVNLSELINKRFIIRSDLQHLSNSGIYTVDLSFEQLNISTCDIYDSNGNLVFAKNANIEDYM